VFDWNWFSFVVGALAGLGAMWIAAVVSMARRAEDADRERGNFRF
jgi:hypothetical protein